MIPEELTRFLDRYGAAWNGHDLDAIMAEHTPDTVFHLHAGAPEAVGIAAVRWTVAATLATPLELADSTTAAPSGRQVRFDAVDVLVLEGGQIAPKNTYVDSLSLQRQLAESVPAAA